MLSDEQIAAIATELAAGQKINAIKLYREYTGLGLAEAKAAIEQFRASDYSAGAPDTGAADTGAAEAGLSDQQLASILAELRAQKMIQAIKLYRQYMGVGLADAKAAVEQLAAANGIRPAASKSGCGTAVMFCLVVAVATYWIVR